MTRRPLREQGSFLVSPFFGGLPGKFLALPQASSSDQLSFVTERLSRSVYEKDYPKVPAFLGPSEEVAAILRFLVRRTQRSAGVSVIGVAKTRFTPAVHAIPVVRGNTKRPLYVTSAGIAPADAAELVRTMTGKFRLPDALRRVDALARAHETRNSLPFSHLSDDMGIKRYRN
jgi:hypothetical protein